MFSTSDDSAMTKQVQATHAPDGREIDVKPILQIVDEILVRFIARTVEGYEVRLTLLCYYHVYVLPLCMHVINHKCLINSSFCLSICSCHYYYYYNMWFLGR